jgi:hypothetical protein
MKIILWNKLGSIVITRSDIVTNYLMKVTQVHDQLAGVGEKVADEVKIFQVLSSCQLGLSLTSGWL